MTTAAMAAAVPYVTTSRREGARSSFATPSPKLVMAAPSHWSLIFSENRIPPRIKSGQAFSGSCSAADAVTVHAYGGILDGADWNMTG
jgi:hypothetical protein